MVLAAGAWSGSLLGTTTGDARWRDVFKPRRGHLLELDPPAGMPRLRHGLMEMGYTQVRQIPARWACSKLLTVRDGLTLAEWMYCAQVCCLSLLAVVEEALIMHCLQLMRCVIGKTDRHIDVLSAALSIEATCLFG